MYKIKNIYEKDGNTIKKESQYRIGREGIINTLDIGKPLILAYQNNKELIGKVLVTSFVENILTSEDNKLGIVTENSIYVLEKI